MLADSQAPEASIDVKEKVVKAAFIVFSYKIYNV